MDAQRLFKSSLARNERAAFFSARDFCGLVHMIPARASQGILGCKPKPPKISSPQLQPRHDRIQVDQLPVAAESVVSGWVTSVSRCDGPLAFRFRNKKSYSQSGMDRSVSPKREYDCDKES